MRETPAFVLGIGETPRLRHWPVDLSTLDVLKEAAQLALSDAGLTPNDIDGFALASFTVDPDRAIDVAWRLGLSVKWLVQDTNGGAAGLNLLNHALAVCGKAPPREFSSSPAISRAARHSFTASRPTTPQREIISRRSVIRGLARYSPC